MTSCINRVVDDEDDGDDTLYDDDDYDDYDDDDDDDCDDYLYDDLLMCILNYMMLYI